MNIRDNHLIKFVKDNDLILIISFINFFIIFFPNLLGYYGYSRDELYLIACSKRLALGYIDHPPFSVFLMSVIRLFGGDSLFAIRFVPALAHSFSIFFVGIITKRLGGKKFAQVLACLAFSVMPYFLLIDSIYSKIFLEQFLLTACILTLLIIIQEEKKTFWLLLGFIVGIGLLSKYTFIIYSLAILIGIIFTPLRKYFLEKYFWLGVFLVIILVLPNIIWQIDNNFISIEFLKFRLRSYEAFTPPVFHIIGQIILINPLVFPICVMGFFSLFFRSENKPYRVFCWIVLVPLAFFILMKSRIDRVAPVYPILISSGSIVTEALINKSNKHWLKSFIISLLVIGGIFSFLVFLPVFSPKTFPEYSKKVVSAGQEFKKSLPNSLSLYYQFFVNKLGGGAVIEDLSYMGKPLFLYYQFFVDRLGWESMAEDVSIVYNKLSDVDKRKAAIFALNYGEASAIEFFGRKYNLPPVVSIHNNYRLWGYGNATGDLVISIGVEKDILKIIFERVEESGVIHTCKYCMGYEDNLPIYICRKTKVPVKELWHIINREVLPPIIQ